MADQSITETVREKYGRAARQVETGKTACCGTAPSASGLSGDPITSNLYEISQKGEIPETALAASLGCGNPTALAKLRPAKSFSISVRAAASTCCFPPGGSGRAARPTAST